MSASSSHRSRMASFITLKVPVYLFLFYKTKKVFSKKHNFTEKANLCS